MKLNVMGPRPAVDSIPLRWTTAVLALLFAPIVLAQSRGTIIPDEVPVGAYVRTLGDVSPAQSLVLPTAITPPPGLPGHDKTTAVASGGISLGGIGAGSFEINQFGTFGPWNFDGQHEQRILTQAALHIREQLKGQAASVRTLAMNGNIGDALPAAWPLLNKGDAVYSALYPFGWINYKPFATRVITRFWSPIVSNSDELSSMPVAYFDVQVTNPKKVDATVSVMFTFPNAAAHVAGTSAANWMTGKPIAMTGSSRTSLAARWLEDKRTGISGLTLSGTESIDQTDETETEWTIAAAPIKGSIVTYATSWNAAGDGKDILDSFSSFGKLPNGDLDRSHSAGAVAVSVILRPGETKTIPFVLAWDFPHSTFRTTKGSTVWMKRYTEYLGAKETPENNYVPGSYPGHQGFNLADHALSGRDKNLTAVNNWWSTIAQNGAYPPWLRGAALNQLTYDVAGGSFWEAGLIKNSVPPTGGRRLGTITPGTHLFFFDTGSDGSDTGAFSADVSPYADLHLQQMFPHIERDILRASAEIIERNPDSHLDSFGNTDGGSPFVEWPLAKMPVHIDHDLLFLTRSWQYYILSGDRSTFKLLYPAMLKAYRTDKSLFLRDGDALPVDGMLPNTHDLLPSKGNGIYNSALWTLAAEIMEAASKDPVLLTESSAAGQDATSFSDDVAHAKKALESRLWLDDRGYYKFSTDDESEHYGQGLFADALYAEHLSQEMNLPDVVDLQRLKRHLKNIDLLLVAPFVDKSGHSVGAMNLINDKGEVFGGIAEPTFPAFFHQTTEAREVWGGVSYPLAALMITTGRKVGDSELSTDGMRLGEGTAFQIWGSAENGYAFQAPESWLAADPRIHRNLNYSRPLSIWDLLNVYSPFRAAAP